jgi:Male sterility protein
LARFAHRGESKSTEFFEEMPEPAQLSRLLGGMASAELGGVGRWRSAVGFRPPVGLGAVMSVPCPYAAIAVAGMVSVVILAGPYRSEAASMPVPRTGDTVDRRWIAEEVREVVHGAASVAFDLPLAESQSINVEGTRRILDLAEDCAARGEGLRRVTYVSTAYVAGDRHGRAREADLDAGPGFRTAYEQSKHEADVGCFFGLAGRELHAQLPESHSGPGAFAVKRERYPGRVCEVERQVVWTLRARASILPGARGLGH